MRGLQNGKSGGDGNGKGTCVVAGWVVAGCVVSAMESEAEIMSELGTTGQGSAGNVIAALASFFIPGLGQLIQGRFLKAVIMFVLAGLLWMILLGWIVHLWSIIDAAVFRPRG